MNLLDSALVCAAQKRCSKMCPLHNDECAMVYAKDSMVDLIAAQHEELVLLRKVAEAAGALHAFLGWEPASDESRALKLEAENALTDALTSYTTWKEQHHG